jgi:phosphoglycolate phosphatase-like HAD superfamily hydrolase
MDVGLIFDLDGTLLDSSLTIGQAMNKTRLDCGFSTLGPDAYTRLVGLPAIELLSDLNIQPHEKVAIIGMFRQNLIETLQYGVPVFEDTVKTLNTLKNLGYDFGVATSKPTELAQRFIKNSELAQFDFTVQGTDDNIFKPNPKVILDCINKMSNQEYVMIGDRVEDVVAGISAGILSLGISQTSHSYFQLKHAGAYAVVDRISKIIKYF